MYSWISVVMKLITWILLAPSSIVLGLGSKYNVYSLHCLIYIITSFIYELSISHNDAHVHNSKTNIVSVSLEFQDTIHLTSLHSKVFKPFFVEMITANVNNINLSIRSVASHTHCYKYVFDKWDKFFCYIAGVFPAAVHPFIG